MFGFDSFGLGDLLTVLQILNTATSAAGTIQGLTQSTPSLTAPPAPTAAAPPPPDPTADPAAQARLALPQQKADTAARLGGGISPEFLASLLGDQAGNPTAGLDILGEIRKSMNVGQA
jgi:hypothetical protein